MGNRCSWDQICPPWAHRGPQGPKRGYSGPIPKFPCPNFLGNYFCFKYRLVGCPERRSGMPGSFSTVLAHMEPPSSRKQAKRVRLGPKRTLLGAPDVLGEPRGGRSGPNYTRLARLGWI